MLVMALITVQASSKRTPQGQASILPLTTSFFFLSKSVFCRPTTSTHDQDQIEEARVKVKQKNLTQTTKPELIRSNPKVIARLLLSSMKGFWRFLPLTVALLTLMGPTLLAQAFSKRPLLVENWSTLALHAASENNEKGASSALTRQEEAKSYLEQAQALRKEAEDMRQTIDLEAEAKKQRELARIDQWINELLLASEGDDNVELLYSVEQVTQLLQEKRISEDHVMSMFRRLSESNAATRSRCSPLIELLVNASGLMDCIERDEQPNKRWSGKVERKLRRRLFARDWGIELDDLEARERGED